MSFLIWLKKQGSKIWNWHLAELRALRNALIMLVVFLYSLILLAMFLPPDYQIPVLLTLVLISDVLGITLAIRRVIVGTEIAWFVGGGSIAASAQRYIEIAAGVLAFTAVMGLFALSLPPKMGGMIVPALVALHCVTGIVFFYIWKKGPGWLSTIIGLVLGGTLVICLLIIYVPYYGQAWFPHTYKAVEDAKVVENADKGVAGIMSGKLDPGSLPLVGTLASQHILLILVGLWIGYEILSNKDTGRGIKWVARVLFAVFLIALLGRMFGFAEGRASVSVRKDIEYTADRTHCGVASVVPGDRMFILMAAGDDWREIEADPNFLDKKMAEGCSADLKFIPYIPEHLPQDQWWVVSANLYLPKGCTLAAGRESAIVQFIYHDSRRIEPQWGRDGKIVPTQLKPGLPIRLDTRDSKGRVLGPVSASVICSS